MQVNLIPQEEINSDLGVVNAARVSLNKRHNIFEENDTKLLNYLAVHNHWTPFAHSSMYFCINWPDYNTELDWYKKRNQAGFQHITNTEGDFIKGSLIGWIKNIQYLPKKLQGYILYELYSKYPKSVRALTGFQELDPFNYLTGGLVVSPEYIKLNYPELYTVTLLIKCPIAIARQVRTSQVGFSYSDYYVEGESFVYNEVSRRYVNDEPEFYTVEQWRVREGWNVKQGSTDILRSDCSIGVNLAQDEIYHNAKSYYHTYNSNKIAPEQLRFLLPQSMYTEFYMTGTLSRWVQWLSLRSDEHVQLETRYLAAQVLAQLTLACPEYLHKAGIKILT